MSLTSIEWTDRTWNCIRGCSRVSEGCRNCYAERIAARFSDRGELEDPGVWLREPGPFHGFARRVGSEARWTGRVELIPQKLDEPLRWRKPCRVFVNSMSDLFHESLPDEAIDRVFAVMLLAPRHTFQILTKRPARMAEYFKAPDLYSRVLRWVNVVRCDRPKDHLSCVPVSNPADAAWRPWIWLGVSVEDQATADERIPELLQTPAAVRFVSYEPALGPVDFGPYLGGWRRLHTSLSVEGAIRNRWFDGLIGPDGRLLTTQEASTALCDLLRDGVEFLPLSKECDDFDPKAGCRGHANPRLDWIIVGGESGPGARPFDVAWARSAVEQCRAAGVPVFYKQGGASNACPHDRKGGHLECFPPELRIREFPSVRS